MAPRQRAPAISLGWVGLEMEAMCIHCVVLQVFCYHWSVVSEHAQRQSARPHPCPPVPCGPALMITAFLQTRFLLSLCMHHTSRPSEGSLHCFSAMQCFPDKKTVTNQKGVVSFSKGRQWHWWLPDKEPLSRKCGNGMMKSMIL